MVAVPSETFLTKKAGALPVWGWALLGLILAYAYSRYQSNKATKADNATTSASTVAGEPNTSPPEFVIEENLPPGAPTDVTVNTPVTVSPPGMAPAPPVGGGHHPPVGEPPPPVRGTGPSPAPTPPHAGPPSPPGRKEPIVYRVVHGDTLSSIAARYHTTWQALWAYNTTPGNRPASTIATLKQRGPNLIYAGEEILIPQ